MKLFGFIMEGAAASISSVVEITNFVIFLGKSGAFWVKAKTFYEIM